MLINNKVSSKWLVSSDMHGLRADEYLKRRVGRISKTKAQSIISSGDLLIDNAIIKPSYRIKNGQQVTLLRIPPDHKDDLKDFVVEKIFENDDILVLNKPYGLSIHPTATCLYKTVTFWLKSNYQEKINPCHRLDKETTGILICAKNPLIESSIKKAFMHGLVSKTYLAVVRDHFLASRLIDIPLELQGDRGLVAIRMIKDSAGKKAQTYVRPLVYNKKQNTTLLLCKPLTGRQHQIRAHLSLTGHPIVGDKLYAHPDEVFDKWCSGDNRVIRYFGHHRHALHAARLKITINGCRYVFKCGLPKDFYELFR